MATRPVTPCAPKCSHQGHTRNDHTVGAPMGLPQLRSQDASTPPITSIEPEDLPLLSR